MTCSATGDDEGRLILSAPLTHADWIWNDARRTGEEGVRCMLDTCKSVGWSEIYWRVLDGGLAMYDSEVVEPEVCSRLLERDWIFSPKTEESKRLAETYGITPELMEDARGKVGRLDYSAFDPLAVAVPYAHEIGIELHAWISINEDDHAWGLESRYTLEHPESRWVKRDGTVYRSQLSFAFPEVMEYKVAIVKEILDGYDVDGVFVDWIRTGDVRDNPQTDPDGVADYGYEAPLLERFKAEYGLDPREVPNGDSRWVACRAEPQTEFMRRARALLRAERPGIPLSVLVHQPWAFRGMHDPIDDNLRGILLDVETWAREGLIDAIVPSGYYREGGSAELAYKHLRGQVGDSADVWMYAWVPSQAADFERDFGVAEKLGADHILFWEAHNIDFIALEGVEGDKKREIATAMRARALMPG